MSSVERPVAMKRRRMHLIQDAISSNTTSSDAISTDSNFSLHAPASASSSMSKEGSIHSFQTEEKGIQVNVKNPYRSRGINAVPEVTSVGCLTENINVSVSTNTSPVKFTLESHQDILKDSDSSEFNYPEEGSNDSSFSGEEDEEKEKFKQHMVAKSVLSIEKEPKLFLRIPRSSLFLVKILAERTKLPVTHIYVVLKKIRLNISFSILAVDFGLTSSSICRIFAKSLPVIASLMQELIVWPDARAIKENLPIPFRARYSNVISIIDCLEIEIEKPSNPVSQALTWSNYYNCNTLKYLVSCTPDGLVTFISDGFGGRASDAIIVEHSGYLDKLAPGASIMADRGFKNISNLLQQKNCTLIRPPTVSSENKSSKEEIKESKRIAALRIHVERVIRRLREFKMLGPHACVDIKHVPILDFAIIIACGIINMQDHLIKH